MPFDSSTCQTEATRVPFCCPRGGRSAFFRFRNTIYARAVLTDVIELYESGKWTWTQGECSPRWPHKGICAGYAVRRVKNQLRIKNDIVYDYVARAIEREIWIPDVCETSFETIIWYNDRPGRTFEEVLNVLRRALRLARQEVERLAG
jgi:hypothetical protein